MSFVRVLTRVAHSQGPAAVLTVMTTVDGTTTRQSGKCFSLSQRGRAMCCVQNGLPNSAPSENSSSLVFLHPAESLTVSPLQYKAHHTLLSLSLLPPLASTSLLSLLPSVPAHFAHPFGEYYLVRASFSVDSLI